MRNVTSDKGLLEILLSEGHDFFTGVPDSGLKRFISELEVLPPGMHVTATWEAEAVAIAAGSVLAGRKPCVYLQNAGLGHTVNPLTSLCIPYDLRPTLVVGHRHGLPQHRVMGAIDSQLIELMAWNEAILVGGDNNEQ
ncbi:MAG: thiamine pyrophosphate-binding protein [Acidimicrobiales bacterium]